MASYLGCSHLSALAPSSFRLGVRIWLQIQIQRSMFLFGCSHLLEHKILEHKYGWEAGGRNAWRERLSKTGCVLIWLLSLPRAQRARGRRAGLGGNGIRPLSKPTAIPQQSHRNPAAIPPQSRRNPAATPQQILRQSRRNPAAIPPQSRRNPAAIPRQSRRNHAAIAPHSHRNHVVNPRNKAVTPLRSDEFDWGRKSIMRCPTAIT